MPATLLLAALLLGCAAGGAIVAPGADFASPHARELAARALRAMDPDNRYRDIRYLRLDLVEYAGERETARRTHILDLRERRQRVEMKWDGRIVAAGVRPGEAPGRPPEVGVVVGLDARRVSDPAIEAAVARFAARDVRWPLLVFRLGRAGVRVQDIGEMNVAGSLVPTLAVLIDDPAAPDQLDRWWLHLHPETHVVAAVSRARRGAAADLRTFVVTRWEERAGVRFPVRFVEFGGHAIYAVEALGAPEAVDPELFLAPAYTRAPDADTEARLHMQRESRRGDRPRW